MSRANEQARHVSTCKKQESITQECPIIVADSNSSNVPPQKRKEDAKPILYLDRV
jgi:hypothetical protein